MHLIVDIDQTLFPLLPALSTLPGGEMIKEQDCHHWDSLATLCARPLSEMIDEAIQPEVANEIGLYPGSRETVSYFLERDIKVSLATHRSRAQEKATRLFLKDQKLDHLPLFIDEDLDKVDLLLPGGVLIDDAPHVLSAGALQGHWVTSLKHRYNRDVAKKHGLKQGSDWQELQKIVEEFLF